MPNQHIHDYLEYYTGLERPCFAVMITGAWGVGKTWLVRNYFTEHPREKHVYVSLYGAGSADEIAQRLFVALHPVLASKGVAIAGRVIKGLLKASISLNLDGVAGEDARANPDLPSLEDAGAVAYARMKFFDTTIVLDDLERCSLKPPELWGFVNRLMEHDGARIVLLANEEKLADVAHRETKEKNIGITLRVAPDLARILPIFLRKESERLLLPLEKQILRVLHVAMCENLRVIRFVVRDLGRILSAISDTLLENAALLASLTGATVALGVEVYSGSVTPRMVKALSMARYMARRAGGVAEDEEEARLRQAFEKYIGILESGYVPPSLGWWYEFFERGVLNATALNEELSARFDKTDKRPSWLRITSLSALEDEEFDCLLEETWKDLSGSRLRILGAILHVAGVQIWASRNDLSERPMQDIVDAARAAIEALEDDEFFAHYRLDWADEHLEAYAGVRFAESESAEFGAIVECAQKVQVDAISARARLKANEILAALQKGGAEAFEAVLDDHGEPRSPLDKAVLRAPILNQIDLGTFAAALLSRPATELNSVLGALYRRLRSHHITEEREWTRDVAKVVKDGEGIRRYIAGRRLEHLLD